MMRKEQVSIYTQVRLDSQTHKEDAIEKVLEEIIIERQDTDNYQLTSFKNVRCTVKST
jgi:hypothetical protein